MALPRVADQDATNRAIWQQPDSLSWLGGLQGFTDAGESAAFWHIVDEIRNKPILDLGVGGGRTIPLLRSLTPDYVAIDYVADMVDLARRKYPAADVQAGDARDLSRFADDSFSLVNFSFSGIDAVDRAGRRRIFAEAWRVLKPNGIFWFSTLNKEGGGLRERPWRLRWPSRKEGNVRFLVDSILTVKHLPGSMTNYGRLKRQGIEGDGWSVAPFSAHRFGLLVHYTTLAHLREELTRAGYLPDCVVFDPAGERVNDASSLRDIEFFNILARKPVAKKVA